MLNILPKTLNYKTIKLLKVTLPPVLLLLLGACSATGFSDLFSNYNDQMKGVKSAQLQGNFTQAIASIPPRSESDGTYDLTELEKGRLEYLLTNHDQSKQHFATVYQKVQQAEQAAKLQISRGIETLSATVSNDSAIRYDIPYYEQSMLNSYQALNYLNQKDLSGALVEIRRANLVQKKALQANQQEIFDSEKKMADKGVSSQTLASKYPSQSNVIGQVKNGFQNAYTFYLSGILYEAGGQANDAYIDYKKALEIFPSNTIVQKDIWRLANQLGMGNDIELFKQRFASSITQSYPKETITENTKPGINNIDKELTGQLVFIVEQGIINSKQQASLSLPIYTSHNDVRFYSVALPVYPNQLQQYSGLSFNYKGKQYRSEEIVRLQSLAAKHLQDEMPAIVTRQIVRVVAKEEIRQQVARKGGNVGNIFANIYNIVSEKADTRSWSTLPDSIQILRLDLTVGQHVIDITVNGKNQTVTVDINEDRQTLITLTSIGRYTNYQSLNL